MRRRRVGHATLVRAEAWRDISELQHGIVSRRQLLEIGLTPAQARRNVANTRWQQVFPGVYATFTGPISEVATLWAAVLYAGEGAAVSHLTALWLFGVIGRRPGVVHVAVPAPRKVVPQPGIRIHRTRAAVESVHPAARPPRSRIEVAVLDHSDGAPVDVALDVVLRATQGRFTTPARLRKALRARARHSHRALLMEVLTEVQEGVQSMLERRYLRHVERPHGLPSGARNRAERDGNRGNRYRDVRYSPWTTVVELDGRAAHPPDEQFRDHRRDNAVSLAGNAVLRFGWRDVAVNPCAVAADVVAMLRSRGWRGTPTACGSACFVHQAA